MKQINGNAGVVRMLASATPYAALSLQPLTQPALLPIWAHMQDCRAARINELDAATRLFERVCEASDVGRAEMHYKAALARRTSPRYALADLVRALPQYDVLCELATRAQSLMNNSRPSDWQAFDTEIAGNLIGTREQAAAFRAEMETRLRFARTPERFAEVELDLACKALYQDSPDETASLARYVEARGRAQTHLGVLQGEAAVAASETASAAATLASMLDSVGLSQAETRLLGVGKDVGGVLLDMHRLALASGGAGLSAAQMDFVVSAAEGEPVVRGLYSAWPLFCAATTPGVAVGDAMSVPTTPEAIEKEVRAGLSRWTQSREGRPNASAARAPSSMRM